MEISELPNLGPASMRWLQDIGISTVEALIASGVIDTYLKLEFRFPEKITLTVLHALYGAVHDVHWRNITPEIKSQLRAEIE